MIDSEIIASVREPGFSRRAFGYDRHQVDEFLSELASRLEAVDDAIPARSAEAEALTGVGEKVEEILATTREAAEQAHAEAAESAGKLKRESEEAAEQLRREAEQYAEETRKAADEYDSATRSEADAEAARLREDAQAQAEAKVAAAEQDAAQMLVDAKTDLERVERSIEELRERRQLVVASIERMRGDLDSVVGDAERGTTELLVGDDGELLEDPLDGFDDLEAEGDSPAGGATADFADEDELLEEDTDETELLDGDQADDTAVLAEDEGLDADEFDDSELEELDDTELLDQDVEPADDEEPADEDEAEDPEDEERPRRARVETEEQGIWLEDA